VHSIGGLETPPVHPIDLAVTNAGFTGRCAQVR